MCTTCRRIADLVDPDGSNPDGSNPDGSNPDGSNPDGTDAPWLDDPDGPTPTGTVTGTVGGLRLHRGFEGRWRLEADLDPVTGERLWTLLDHLDAPDPRPGPQPDRGAHGGWGEGRRDRPRRSFAQRRHDAFARLLEAAETLPGLPTRHGARPRVLVTVDLLSLVGHDGCATRRTRLAGGGELAVDAALDLLAHASVTPACDRPIAWDHGGDTDLNRTVPGCPAHHRLRDVAGWHVAYDPDTGRVTRTRPDGNHTDGGYTHTTDPPQP